MPRQPFLPVYGHLDYAVGAKNLSGRPEFCAAIGKCIAFWTYVENEFNNLFSVLVGARSEAMLGVFQTLRRNGSQREALQSAAKYRLTDSDDQSFFGAIVKAYGALEKERNALAHGCFGVCSDSSLILWTSLEDHVQFQTRALSTSSSTTPPIDPHRELKETMYVYRLEDFELLYDDMTQLWEGSRHFNSYLRTPTDKARVDEYKRVMTLPLIKAFVGSPKT